MRDRLGLIVVGTALSILPLVAAQQQAPQAPAAGQGRRAASSASDEGIPITDPDVRSACGSCHTADDKNRMTRISYRRATPENWELTIRRMITLNHVALTPEVARKVIKSLSDSNGLAPEEARPAMFDAERRLIDYTYTGDKDTHDLCNKCHSMGRVISERRTKEEWAGLLAMHRYYYPGIDGASGGFRAGGPGGGRGRGGNAAQGRAGGEGRGPSTLREPQGRPEQGRGATSSGQGDRRQP